MADIAAAFNLWNTEWIKKHAIYKYSTINCMENIDHDVNINEIFSNNLGLVWATQAACKYEVKSLQNYTSHYGP